ncbi:MAG: S-layer homology domain-containing protein, partial [Anaerotignum sp.]
GSWDEWGSVQSTSNVIAGLSFYQGTDEKIEEAIENAVAYLHKVQNSDGRFDDGYGPDANVAAMAVIGLCAAGVNPDTDDRFVKDGVSALDGLLSFALTDNSGFGYNDNSAINAYATEQAFRALIAAKQVMKTGKAFNIYDFSHNSDSLTPGRATGSGSETKPDNPPAENDDITVDVTIRPDVGYWMKNKYVTVDEGATVYHAFIKALEGSGITQEGAESGYVSSMTYQGRTLGEFTLGENDGWLYKVNGELPDVGLKEYALEDGDSILWYYTEDWTKDSAAGAGYKEEIEEKNQEAAEKVGDLIDKIGIITKDSGEAIKAAREAYDALTKEQKELVKNYGELLQAEEAFEALLAALEKEEPQAEIKFTDVAEESYYYDAVQWAVANGITAGVTEDAFGPEWTCSRGQLATFLWRLAGSPAPKTKAVPYIDVAEESYYHDAILWAMENDIAKGTDGISFSPEMTVTRAQAVTFLWRAMGSPAPSGKVSFGDVPETAYYHDAILWAAENGITSGTGEGMFSPDTSCQRGQIVTFLYRAFGK